MRIEEINIQNYRQLKNVNIILTNPEGKNDLNIIIGKNGTGKTNILNAINWCLYGEEPLLSKDSQGLPLLNLNTIKENENSNQKQKVSVEIVISINHDEKLHFCRQKFYRIYNIDEPPILTEEKFFIRKRDEKGNTTFIDKGEQVATQVERFVPRDISDFFFFDGEKLDNYFKSATSQKIKKATFLISQIDILENQIERKLKDLLKEYRKEAGRASPEIDKVQKELNDVEEQLNGLSKTIEEIKEQRDKFKELVTGCQKRVANIPNTKELNEELQRLKSNIKHNKDILKSKEEIKNDLLMDYIKIIMTWPATKKVFEVLKDRRDKNDIPPKVDRNILNEILDKNLCSICGSELNENNRKNVMSLINKTISSEVLQDLVNIENSLLNFQDKFNCFEENIKNISKEIENYKKNIDETEEQIGKINKKLLGYNDDKIRKWYEELEENEKNLSSEIQKLAEQEHSRQEKEKKQKELKDKLDKEISKLDKLKMIERKISFCSKAISIVSNTKVNIMNSTKEKINEKTNEYFFKLVWKDSSFAKINFDEEYNIKLIHNIGYDCLGTIGAAERELLALSFTLALHSVSGFNAPIIVDTPVARVDNENRENFGHVFANITSSEKQAIILFTPSEYSDSISKIIDLHANKRFNIVMSSDENESQLEEL